MSSQDDNRTPAAVRARIARRQITGHTAGLCPGFAQANLVILPQDWAFEFLLFCQRNPKPCPVLEVLDPGQPLTRVIADQADVRTDLPRYRIWQKGELVEEPLDITPWWREDLVSFVLGCSFGFDLALQEAGLPVRHLDMGRNVPMFRTSRPNVAAGRLGRAAGGVHAPHVAPRGSKGGGGLRPLREVPRGAGAGGRAGGPGHR